MSAHAMPEKEREGDLRPIGQIVVEIIRKAEAKRQEKR